VLRAKIEDHDQHGETLTFVTQAAAIWSYDVAVVLEFNRDVLQRFPTLRLPARGGPTPRDVDVGLLNAVVEAAREMHESRYQAAFALYESGCRPEDQADVVVSTTTSPRRASSVSDAVVSRPRRMRARDVHWAGPTVAAPD
jgi:hypothetical protein